VEHFWFDHISNFSTTRLSYIFTCICMSSYKFVFCSFLFVVILHFFGYTHVEKSKWKKRQRCEIPHLSSQRDNFNYTFLFINFPPCIACTLLELFYDTFSIFHGCKRIPSWFPKVPSKVFKIKPCCTILWEFIYNGTTWLTLLNTKVLYDMFLQQNRLFLFWSVTTVILLPRNNLLQCLKRQYGA